MRDLRQDLRHYIDLRRALGYRLRKHEPRLTEFIAFLEAKGSDSDHNETGSRLGNRVFQRP